MKMKTADFEVLRTLIEQNHPSAFLRSQADLYRGRGRTSKRFRWDMLWAIPFKDSQNWFDRGIYNYLNDDHIDTALRVLIPHTW